MSEKNKNNVRMKKDDLESSNNLHNSEQSTQKPKSIETEIKNERNRILLWWDGIETGNKTQIILVIFNIIMVGAFIYFGFEQIEKTNEALKRADTSNSITRESLQFTKRTTLSSDSSTKQALRISDSTLAVYEQIMKINKIAMITVNTPYIQIKAKMVKFVPDTIEFKLTFKNVGITPVLYLHTNIGFNFSPPNDRPVVHEPKKLIGNFLAPQDSVFYDPTPPVHIAISPELYNNIFLGINEFKLGGILTYNDVFGYKYRLEFYYIWEPSKNIFLSPNIGNTYNRIKDNSN